MESYTLWLEEQTVFGSHEIPALEKLEGEARHAQVAHIAGLIAQAHALAAALALDVEVMADAYEEARRDLAGLSADDLGPDGDPEPTPPAPLALPDPVLWEVEGWEAAA